MSRELILMRHAEAAPGAGGADDFARPLTPAGREAATAAAQRLLQQHGAPDLLVCSPAVRTATTAEAVRAALGSEVPVQSDARIYLASPGLLLQVLAECPDTARRVLLVAHNPAVSQLAAALHAGSGHVRPLATAEFRHFTLPGHWRELREPA